MQSLFITFMPSFQRSVLPFCRCRCAVERNCWKRLSVTVLPRTAERQNGTLETRHYIRYVISILTLSSVGTLCYLLIYCGFWHLAFVQHEWSSSIRLSWRRKQISVTCSYMIVQRHWHNGETGQNTGRTKSPPDRIPLLNPSLRKTIIVNHNNERRPNWFVGKLRTLSTRGQIIHFGQFFSLLHDTFLFLLKFVPIS